MFNIFVGAGAAGAGAGAASRNGSGSDKKMRLLAAPAPQHCLSRYRYSKLVFRISETSEQIPVPGTFPKIPDHH
jgi:hypothetical protein